MNDTKYLVLVDDGDNQTTHEIFADSPEQAKMIVVSNGISAEHVINVVAEEGESSQIHHKQKEIINPVTGEKMLVDDDSPDQPIDENLSPKQESTNQLIPAKVYNLNGITIGIINGEMYTQSWVDVNSKVLEDKKEYRIINTKSNKLVNNINYQIQVKQWIKLPTE